MATTVAFTIALGNNACVAARLARKTFKANHPDIPFFIIDIDFYHFFARQARAAHPGEIVSLRTMVGYFLSLCFDRVIYLDSDVLILSPLVRLVEDPSPVILTNDVDACHYGLPPPWINNGVFASTSSDFWGLYMSSAYSYLLPITGNFFDQFVLRLLCIFKKTPYTLLTEREDREFYNLSCRDYPGEWRREGDDIYKGDARVRLWHWAGFIEKPTIDNLPEPVREVVQRHLRTSHSNSRQQEDDLLRFLLTQHGPAFLKMVEKEFQTLSTHVLDGVSVETKTPLPGIYGTDAPSAWDVLRSVPEGFHRRYLHTAGRFIYSREEALLHHPDVNAIDVPGIA